MRVGFALVGLAACGRVDFDPIPHRVLYAATRAPDQLAAFAISDVDGSLQPLAGTPLVAPTPKPTAVAVDALDQFVFLAGEGPPGLATFAFDPATGAPTTVTTFDVTPFVTPAFGFAAVTVDPTGRFVYTGDAEDNNFALALDRATGQVSFVNVLHVNATATSSVVDLRGRWLVTPGQGTSCTIQVQTIDQASGALSPPAQYTPSSCLTDAEHAAVDATAQHVYIAENGNCAIYGYPIDPTTGVIDIAAPVAGSAQFEYWDCLWDVELHPSGTWIYAAGSGVIVVGIDPATGAIAPRAAMGPNTVADTSIDRIVITPDGSYLYGIEHKYSNQLYAYSIDASTGALAPAPGSPYAVAGMIMDVAVGGPFQYR